LRSRCPAIANKATSLKEQMMETSTLNSLTSEVAVLLGGRVASPENHERDTRPTNETNSNVLIPSPRFLSNFIKPILHSKKNFVVFFRGPDRDFSV
jgi:hypothetical protein